MLKTYGQESEIPEELKAHYVENDGVWVPDGFVPKSKVEEFRANNRSLAKEREELQTQLLRFKDIDPDKYSESVQKLQELENDRLAEAGEWKVLKANLEQSHSDAIKFEKANAAKVQAGWNAEKIANQTAMTVLKYAMPAEGNMKYIQNDIKQVTAIDPDTNKIVFLDDKGVKINGESGEALTLDEYLTKTYIPTSNLFQKSEGSGAIGGVNIPMAAHGQVSVENISGRDIPGSMIADLASGKIIAIN